MIDIKSYILKNGKKREFFNKILDNYHPDQRENIACFNECHPSDEPDEQIKDYHVFDTTVFINDYDESKYLIVAKITAWGETEKDFEEKVNKAKTLLEKLGEAELIEINASLIE